MLLAKNFIIRGSGNIRSENTSFEHPCLCIRRLLWVASGSSTSKMRRDARPQRRQVGDLVRTVQVDVEGAWDTFALES